MSEFYNQAPAMHADYPDTDDYDMVILDWYCDIDAPYTYWATMQIKRNSGGIDAYGGFQNARGTHQHLLLFSLWENGTNYPEIEYISALVETEHLNFEELGDSGKHIFTDFSWSTNTWYKICIGVKNYGGKTHYAQWVKEYGSDNWFLCGIISFPQTNKIIGYSSSFQEAFNRNNSVMRCKLRNIFGRFYGTNTWEKWNSIQVRNRYRPYVDPPTIYNNVKVDCLCGIDTSDNSLWLQAGGGGLDPENPAHQTNIDFDTTYTLSSADSPDSFPEWAPLVPRYIYNKDNQQYLAPTTNGAVTYRSNAYYWIFTETADGYIKILNDKKTLALTISNTTAGSSLTMSSISTSDNQKWQRKSELHTEYSYITPKNASSLDIGIQNNDIKLCSHNESNDANKWKVLNESMLNILTSYISALYVTPVNNNIVQTLTQYKWNIVVTEKNSSNDILYFSILTTDNKKAITLPENEEAGTDLILADYSPGNTKQIWKLQSAGSDYYYIRSRFNSNLAIDVQGQSYNPNAPIQVNNFTSGSGRLKWCFE